MSKLSILKNVYSWGLEYQTYPDFEWSKVARMLNSSDFKWHSKIKQPNHSKFDQIAAILDSNLLVLLLNGQDFSMVNTYCYISQHIFKMQIFEVHCFYLSFYLPREVFTLLAIARWRPLFQYFNGWAIWYSNCI